MVHRLDCQGRKQYDFFLTQNIVCTHKKMREKFVFNILLYKKNWIREQEILTLLKLMQHIHIYYILIFIFQCTIVIQERKKMYKLTTTKNKNKSGLRKEKCKPYLQ